MNDLNDMIKELTTLLLLLLFFPVAADLLGLPLIPAHSQASSTEDAVHGLNYASAAAGILDITGQNFVMATPSSSPVVQLMDVPHLSVAFHARACIQVGRIPFNQQIRNFETTLDQIAANMGADGVAGAISRCIFFVGMGSNDYLNNYLMPNYATRNQYNADQFAELLVQQYTRQLTVSPSPFPTSPAHLGQ